MIKKRVFAGKNMHIEFHNVNQKKQKAADCIYLHTDRTCHNKKCPEYLAKCFVASTCSFRLRQKDADEIELKKELHNRARKRAQLDKPHPKQKTIKRIKCTIPSHAHIFSPAFGKGSLAGYDENDRLLSVKFEDAVRKFKYPDAILEKHLILPEFAFKRVLIDISQAEKG